MFDQHFQVILADTERTKEIYYNLRYRVYCLERQFENPNAYPDKKECDRYDSGSAQFLVRSIETREWLAGMRLVVAPLKSLPMTQVCELSEDQLPVLTNAGIAEVSRLCALPPRGKLSFGPASCTPWLTMGLIRAARSYAQEHDINYFCFFIADSLARILKRMGIEFTPVGPVSNFRGKRRPYIHDVQLGYREMPLKAPEVHRMFCVAPAYRPASGFVTSFKNNHLPLWQPPYVPVLLSRSV